MKIHGLQFDIAWEDREENFRRVRHLLGKSAVAAGDLVVLPEMFATGFSMNVDRIQEGDTRPGEQFMGDLAKTTGAFVLGGVVRRGLDRRGRNDAVLFAPDGSVTVSYTKIHPFRFAGETTHYGAGSTPVIFEWAGLRAAPFICYDLRFPEIFRHAVLAGAELFIVIANWPAARAAHWRNLLIARAIENQAYLLGVNRCGSDPNVAYSGGSLFVSPQGEVLAEAGDAPEVVTAAPDRQRLLDYRKDFPALTDIRPQFLNAPTSS